MTLHDSCRVRTADRVAQTRKGRSAVRTPQNAKRVFTQGYLGSAVRNVLASDAKDVPQSGTYRTRATGGPPEFFRRNMGEPPMPRQFQIHSLARWRILHRGGMRIPDDGQVESLALHANAALYAITAATPPADRWR